MGFWAREVGTQPRMQLTQMLVPPADLTQRWPDWRRCGMLRGLHAVLAFDEGYQSEGLQLLAWHIEARNARSGCGSRELSQEDSRENSSLSKCNCSANTATVDLYYRVARELASHLRLKLKLSVMLALQRMSGEGTGFSSEIETQESSDSASNVLRGEGTGFSSEIETHADCA